MDCVWTEWGAWSECDCDNGAKRTRNRTTDAGNEVGMLCSQLLGKDTQKLDCPKGECAGGKLNNALRCELELICGDFAIIFRCYGLLSIVRIYCLKTSRWSQLLAFS